MDCKTHERGSLLTWHLCVSKPLDAAILRWLHHYSVSAAVPTNGSISFADLSIKLNLSQRVLTRVVRHAITNHVFAEPFPNHVVHTSLSLLLAQPDNPAGGIAFPSLSHVTETHGQYRFNIETISPSPFNVAVGTGTSASEWVSRGPTPSESFVESRKRLASNDPSNIENTVKAFDWQSLGEGVVVDVCP